MEDRDTKKQAYDEGPQASYGYGGQFGVQKDRMDKVNDVVHPLWLLNQSVSRTSSPTTNLKEQSYQTWLP